MEPGTNSARDTTQIVHIVQFAFKPDTGEERAQELCARLLDLKSKCIIPTTQKPYILSVTGGVNNSPEGFANGFQYAFVMEFASAADRNYYVDSDPAHRAFVQDVGPAVEKLQVLDYEPGTFR